MTDTPDRMKTVRIVPTVLLSSLIAATAPKLSAQAAADTPVVVLHCGAYFDVTSGKRLSEHTIVVQGDKVVEVRPGRAEPAGARAIELPNHTCMPGLIDMHVHITSETNNKSYEEGFRLNPTDYALRGVAYAERTLQAGFTTVRNLGDGGNASISLRNAIDQGWVRGPRIVTAGKSIATTGGHADPTNGRNWELSGDPGPREGVINDVGEARKAVRQRYKDGADVIKITATGGVLSYAKNGQNAQFTVEEIRSVVDTAHDYGMKVAAHAHGDEGVQRAILGGIDSIEHGTFMSDKTLRLMKEHGTYYVPTITAGVWVGEKAKEPGYYPEIVRPKALAVGPQIQKTFTRAYRAGVKIAFGTDAGVFPHGMNGREFALMVEAGMPAAETLRCATVHAADLLGQSEILGSLAPGKFADVVAVPGDPLTDITLMQRVDFVMKGGQVVKSP
jgi:imidazolonepropionase-like amidohydrolase